MSGISALSTTCDQASRAAPNMFPEPCAHCGVSSFIPNTRQPARSERVGKLLKVNDAPHDAEKAALRDIIRAAPATLSEYDEKLALLRSHMASLTEEREKLLMHVDDARKLLQPFRSLPDDVLREIFAHCIPDLDDMNYSSLNSRNAPWLLSHVSSRWRRVVLSSPSLWTTLSFELPKSMAPSHSDVAALARFSYNLTLFLSRSKDCSLSVHLRCPMNVIEIHPLVLNTLQVSALRWSHLHFEVRSLLLSTFFEMSFERLDTLVVVESFTTNPFIQPGNFRAPLLRSVRGWGAHLRNVCLPWKTLVEYEGVSPRLEGSLLTHLASMSALEQLTLMEFNPMDDIDQLSLPMLRSLTLTSRNPHAYSDFLPKLLAPRLQALSLTYTFDFRVNPSRQIVCPNVPTLMRQLRSLEVITVYSNRDTCVDLHSWLQQADNVTRFSLKMPSITTELLDRLISRDDDSNAALLPKLELLHIHLGYRHNWDDVRSRLASCKGRCVIELKQW